MDPMQIKRLKDEHQKGLNLCHEKRKKWEKFKSDYEALKERLETLPDCLSYDVTVPFGNNAFTKGKLVHTNEIMVLLGDNWFAEVSARQAVAIAARRITHCNNMLENLYKEKQQFENWLSYINEVSGNEDLIEIVEDYDEERERIWKEQHAKNVKSYHQQLAEEKETESVVNGTLDFDDDFVSKLEKLELVESNGINDSEEELTDKLELNVKDEEIADDDEEIADDDEEIANDTVGSDDGPLAGKHMKSSLKLNVNCNHLRKTSESETGEDVDDRKRDVNSNGQESSSPKNGKHVRWQDLSKQNIKKITFKHSKAKKQQNSPSCKYKVIDSSEDENHPLIQSPSDIYKHFGNFMQSSPPKSILKVKTPSPSLDFNGPIFPTKDIVSKDSSPETDESISSPFTGEVCERSSPINIVQNKSRPTSHFKSSRKNRKR